MSTLSGLNNTYTHMDKDTRARLAELTQLRIDFSEYQNQSRRFLLQVLANPTAENEQQLEDYDRTVLAPLRARINEQAALLLKQSINLDGIKGLLPLMLAGLMQSVDLSLLFAAIGLDPGDADEKVQQVRTLIAKGFGSDDDSELGGLG